MTKLMALCAALLLTSSVAGKDWGAAQYQSPDIAEYYKTLPMPNSATSCCGEGDVYYADKQEAAPDGSIIAIITDTRPNDFVNDHGVEVHRAPVPVGTRIPIPATALRKKPIPNPTGHTIVFLGVTELGTFVYCYEPQALL